LGRFEYPHPLARHHGGGRERGIKFGGSKESTKNQVDRLYGSSILPCPYPDISYY